MALDAAAQRHILAFLVSMRDNRDENYRKKIAKKMAQSASEFATIEELDRRLGLGEFDDGRCE